MLGKNANRYLRFAGYFAIALLSILYTPIVLGITNVASLIHLGPLQPFWEGIAPTLGLETMVSLIPTFLMLIFRSFFFPKTESIAQLDLQIGYFWFLIAFVLFGGAIGPNCTKFAVNFVSSPKDGMTALAAVLPAQMTFFMDFLVIYWLELAMCLLRLPVLSKFQFFYRIFDADEAKRRSEPEDQDYHSIGARSARLSMLMAVGIVYGTLFPPLFLLCALDFALTRVVFGYLLVFAETKKVDTGGEHWVSMLRCIFAACGLYTCVMTAVLLAFARGPALLSASALVYVLWSYDCFEREFYSDLLPFAELDPHAAFSHSPVDEEYFQEELGPIPHFVERQGRTSESSSPDARRHATPDRASEAAGP